jgi:hypothetical protein
VVYSRLLGFSQLARLGFLEFEPYVATLADKDDLIRPPVEPHLHRLTAEGPEPVTDASFGGGFKGHGSSQ